MNGLTINVNQLSQMNASNRGIKFQKGMLFLGKVNKILPNNFATLQIGGKEYTAKLDIGLKLDHTYWFLVEQINESGVPYITTINNKQAKDPYQQLLEKLQLPKDSLSRLFIQKLNNSQIVMDYAKIPTLINWIKSPPTSSSDIAIQTVLFMVSKKFPLDKKVFDSLMKFFLSESISTKLSALYEQILTVNPKNEVMEEYLKWFNTLKQDQPINPKKLLSLLGIDYEALLQNNLQNQTIQKIDMTQLKPILLKLLQMSNDSKMTDLAQDILQSLSGQQLVNYESGDTTSNYFFQIPVFLQNEQHDLWLKMHGYKDGDGKLNSDNSKLFFYLCLSNLKDTVVELTIQKKVISIKIFNEADISMLMPLFTPTLKEKLNAEGYYLSSVKAYKTENVPTYFFTPKPIEGSKVDQRI